MNTPFLFKKRGQHLFQNTLFQITLVLLNIFFIAFVVHSIDWLNNKQIGLLYLIELPFWIKLFISVALYDITTYWIHIASHKIPLLWRLHRVHHHQEQFYTDSNFADIFIIWDRIFGTFKGLPVERMKYGLKEFDEEKNRPFYI